MISHSYAVSALLQVYQSVLATKAPQQSEKQKQIAAKNAAKIQGSFKTPAIQSLKSKPDVISPGSGAQSAKTPSTPAGSQYNRVFINSKYSSPARVTAAQ